MALDGGGHQVGGLPLRQPIIKISPSRNLLKVRDVQPSNWYTRLVHMALPMSRPWKHPDTGVYWLRRRVPDDLRPLVGKREEKVSLRTKDPQEAKARHAEALAAIEQKWQGLRAPKRSISPPELELAREQVRNTVLTKGPPSNVKWDTDAATKMWGRSTLTWPYTLDAALTETLRVSLLESWCKEEARAYAHHAGINVDDAGLLRLAQAIGFGVQQGLAIEGGRLAGTHQGSYFEAEPIRHSAPAAPRSASFRDILDGWRAEKQPTEKTIYTWTMVIQQLEEFLGHSEASRLTPDDLIRWKGALLNQGLRTKTIRDSKLAPVRAILQWGVNNRRLTDNPAARVQIDVRTREVEKIRGFTDQEAALILRNARTETDPVRRWVPFLCAYSGARLSEICQLRRQDIIEINGVWCMKFVPEAGSLKNANSERAVPLHPSVMDEGFLHFFSCVRSGPLFAGLPTDRFGSRGGNGTKLLGRWVRSLGIDDQRISPSHSWRHRFKTLGRRHGLLPDVVNAITGHHRKIVADAYGEFEIETLSREISKIPPIIIA